LWHGKLLGECRHGLKRDKMPSVPFWKTGIIRLNASYFNKTGQYSGKEMGGQLKETAEILNRTREKSVSFPI
jgi:hypothetical protein